MERGFYAIIFNLKTEMSKYVYKRKINPNSFDRETVLMGVKETLLS